MSAGKLTAFHALLLRSVGPATAFQLPSMAMTEAAEPRPGTDPDRDHVILAAGPDNIASTAVGAIGRAALAGLLPTPTACQLPQNKAPVSRHHSHPVVLALDAFNPSHSWASTSSRTPQPHAAVDGRRSRSRLAARELANAVKIHNTKRLGTQALTWLTDGLLCRRLTTHERLDGTIGFLWIKPGWLQLGLAAWICPA